MSYILKSPVKTSEILQKRNVFELLFPINGLLLALANSPLYAILIPVVFLFPDSVRYEKAVFMVILTIFSLIASFILFRRIRFLEDTEKTTLNSVAQGYMALEGKASYFNGETLRCPHPSVPPMLWYRDLNSISSLGFLLYDNKGKCTLDPTGAELITRKYTYNEDKYSAIFPGDTIYVFGMLETLDKHRNEHEKRSLVSKKLQEWKRNRVSFLHHFDSNKDGIINNGEMKTAKEAATKFVDLALEEVYKKPSTHVVSKPNDGRPFIVSTIHPDKLIKRYKIALWIHCFIWIYLSVLILAMQVA